MALHQASGRWQLGLALALTTCLCWATLPIALKVSLEALDALTITWFRFLLATGVVGAWLAARGELRQFGGLSRRHWAALLGAGVLLLGNYVFFLWGVQFTSPANAQLLIQLAPLLMAIGGIVVFKERFVAGQWLGMALIVGGLLLFFNDQLSARRSSGYVMGAASVVFAAVVWAGYALIQKQLLMRLTSPAVLLVIYALSTLLLWPFAQPTHLLTLDGLHWGMLLYCAVNTLVAYGAFAEALSHWEASRVSAILAITPLLCMGSVAITHAFFPQLIAAETINWLGYAGAALVVAGSMTTSLLGQRRR